MALLGPWPDGGTVPAVDSTPMRAEGSVCQPQDREAGMMLYMSIDTEAHWTKSG
jgi:hypothetical protein